MENNKFLGLNLKLKGDFFFVEKLLSAGDTKEDLIELSVTVRENRAVAKDRGRPLTSIFLPYKSYLKRISTVTFAEVDVGGNKYLKFRATLDQHCRRFAQRQLIALFFTERLIP